MAFSLEVVVHLLRLSEEFGFLDSILSPFLSLNSEMRHLSCRPVEDKLGGGKVPLGSILM